jgi:hypothetical protein
MKISVKTLKGNHFDLQVAEDELVTLRHVFPVLVMFPSVALVGRWVFVGVQKDRWVVGGWSVRWR